MKRDSELPGFEDEQDLAAWVESHDTAPYMDNLDELGNEFEVVRTPLSRTTMTTETILRAHVEERVDARDKVTGAALYPGCLLYTSRCV